jgi:hypothetical protein
MTSGIVRWRLSGQSFGFSGHPGIGGKSLGTLGDGSIDYSIASRTQFSGSIIILKGDIYGCFSGAENNNAINGCSQLLR